jgi:hypothetical protein
MAGLGPDVRNPHSYVLEVLTIVNNEGVSYDCRDSFKQCLITEDIENPFLTGELMLIDSTGQLERAKMTGQESLRIRFYHPGADSENDIIDQLFRIYRIGDVVRDRQNVQTFKCLFASPELIDAKRIRISQAFNGNLLDTVAKIAEDKLGISQDPFDPLEPPAKMVPHFDRRAKSKQEAHIVIPNWTVLDTISFLCSQAQDNDYDSHLTDSYYFHQTARGGYRLHSLRQMYNIDYLGGDPFVYTNVNYSEQDAREFSGEPKVLISDKGEVTGEVGHGRRIVHYVSPTSANVLEGISNGLFGSTLTTVNSTHKYYQEKSYNLLERFYSGTGENSMEPHPFIRQSGEKLHIGLASKDPSADLECRGVYAYYDPLTSYPEATQLLLYSPSYINDKEDNIKGVNSDAHLGASQTQLAVTQLMKYHTIQCLISNRSDISTGQLINLKIPLPSPEGPQEEWEPMFYSGKHLIKKIQWTFTQAHMETNITCMKDSVTNNIETVVPERPASQYHHFINFVGPPEPEST